MMNEPQDVGNVAVVVASLELYANAAAAEQRAVESRRAAALALEDALEFAGVKLPRSQHHRPVDVICGEKVIRLLPGALRPHLLVDRIIWATSPALSNDRMCDARPGRYGRNNPLSRDDN